MEAAITNLARRDWLLRATLATLGLGGLVLVGLISLLGMLLSGASLHQETARTRALTERYISTSQRIEEKLALSQPAAEIKRKLAALNRVVPLGLRLEAVLESLEASHADGLKLRSLSFDRKKGLVRVKVTSRQSEQLFTWIESLAASGEAGAGWDVTLESSEVDDQGSKVYLVHVKEKK
ncbi:hypothetical protein [Microbulbifer sp. PAAF003]|uniref:hypothetical protein n=1 Tax=Microbulbifer sp. PAAF003 TaxID=3243375 RepID=UPI00403A490A